MTANWISLVRIQHYIPMKHHVALLFAAMFCIAGLNSASAAAPSMDLSWRRYYWHRYYYHHYYYHPWRRHYWHRYYWRHY
jgi:hypothetical protein